MWKMIKGLCKFEFYKPGLTHCVSATVTKEDKQVRMAAAGDDTKLVVATKQEKTAPLSTVAEVLMALWRRTISWIIATNCAVMPHPHAALAGSEGSDGVVKYVDENNKMSTVRHHGTAGPFMKYFFVMTCGAARGLTPAQLRDADAAAMQHVVELLSSYNRNLGSAMKEVAEWPTFAGIMYGKYVPSFTQEHGRNEGGDRIPFRQKKKKTGGGGGGGPPRPGGPKKGKTNSGPEKVSAVCRDFQKGPGCTRGKACRFFHGCADCGASGQKKGHTGCTKAWSTASKQKFQRWLKN